jgi:hypothetical protein
MALLAVARLSIEFDELRVIAAPGGASAPHRAIEPVRHFAVGEMRNGRLLWRAAGLSARRLPALAFRRCTVND